jgi:hypothetical protein
MMGRRTWVSDSGITFTVSDGDGSMPSILVGKVDSVTEVFIPADAASLAGIIEELSTQLRDHLENEQVMSGTQPTRPTGSTT